MATNFKWHYHNAAKNETLKALQRGADHPFLLFVGKPGCAICAAQWKALNTAAFDKFMAEHEIVGLKVEDSASHYQALVSGAKLWRNPDNTKINEGPPFLALVKTRGIISDDETITFSLRKSGLTSIDAWICGSTAKYIPAVNAKNVMAWLEAMEKTDAYKSAFPWLADGATPVASGTAAKPATEAVPATEAAATPKAEAPAMVVVPAAARTISFSVTCNLTDAGVTVSVGNIVAK